MATIIKEELNEAEAIELANEILRLESALKQMKEKLKKYVKENGEVDTGERIFYFSESTKWNFKPDGLKLLADYIHLSNKDCWDYLTISSAGLKKLNFDDKILAKFGEKRTSTRFVSRVSKK